MATEYGGTAWPGPDDLEHLDDLQLWWASYGPKTVRGEAALQRGRVDTERRWEQARRRLRASGLHAFQLDNSLDRTDYTVEVEGARVAAEEAYPDDKDEIGAILARFDDIRRRRGPPGPLKTHSAPGRA